jgi:hypothetical protein
MITSTFSQLSIGWMAIATGVVGLLALVTIILFFSIGQPFGTINDYCIGLTAILSMVVVWMLYPEHHAQSPILSQVLLIVALIGAIVVVIGSVLTISRKTGFYLSGMYMAAGNALIGLWLLGINYSALRGDPWPHSLTILGLVSGVFLALGLVAIPGIIRGIDTKEYVFSTYNSIWGTSFLGSLVLYPFWCILLGRYLLLN